MCIRDRCRQNPFASVQPIGRMNVGKKQLRIDEARRFEAVCLKQAESGDTAAFGALLMIYLGLRQSEVAARVKRDIDDEGRVLWIPSGKTKNAKRRLKIPEHLRPLLLTLLTEKESEDRLFYPPNRKDVYKRQPTLRVGVLPNHPRRGPLKLCRLPT